MAELIESSNHRYQINIKKEELIYYNEKGTNKILNISYKRHELYLEDPADDIVAVMSDDEFAAFSTARKNFYSCFRSDLKYEPLARTIEERQKQRVKHATIYAEEVKNVNAHKSRITEEHSRLLKSFENIANKKICEESKRDRIQTLLDKCNGKLFIDENDLWFNSLIWKQMDNLGFCGPQQTSSLQKYHDNLKEIEEILEHVKLLMPCMDKLE